MLKRNVPLTTQQINFLVCELKENNHVDYQTLTIGAKWLIGEAEEAIEASIVKRKTILKILEPIGL